MNQQIISPRAKFEKIFLNPHSLVVALHAKSLQHTLETTDIALSNGAEGVAMVNHYIDQDTAINYANIIKEKYPYHKVLLNILGENPVNIFAQLQGTNVDGIWTDNALIPGVDVTEAKKADDIKNMQEKIGRKGLYFGGINFKGGVQTPEENLGYAITQAKKYIDVVTTSGKGTGYSADPEKIAFLRSITKDFPLSIASGITAENINDYIRNLDLSFVMTGISLDNDKDSLDENKIKALMKGIEKYNTSVLKKRFGEYLLKKYNTDSYANLQSILQNTGIINMGYGHTQEIEKMLSNMYPSPFILDGIEYASVEGFWMSIKYPQEDEKHFTVRGLIGKDAKKAGNEAKYYKHIQYNGHRILVGSPEHHALMKRAIRAKLEQNSEIKKALIESGDKSIIHILFDKDMQGVHADSKTIPGEVFANIVTELRTELQQA